MLVIILGIFVVVFIASSIRIVQQGSVIIIERLGKYHKTLVPGINLIFPFLDKPRAIYWKVTTIYQGRTYSTQKLISHIDLRETVFDFPRQNVITKDNVTIEINAMIYFQVMDPYKAVYEIANLPEAIEKLTQTTLRNIIGEIELDTTLVSRDYINGKLQVILDEATDKWGVKINRVELQDINPPEDIRNAMERQMRAEREKRETILRAEGEKQSAILKAEGDRLARIQEAEGYKQAQILKAEGLAKSQVVQAEAQAKALASVQANLNGASVDSPQYLAALKYIDALEDIAKGNDNKVVFLPYESANVMGALGSIKELLHQEENTKK